LTAAATTGLAEIRRGIAKPKSHFGRACEKLGIEAIAANSPLLKENRTKPRPKDRVIIRICLGGTLNIYWQGKALLVKEIQIENQEACLTGTT
jgi:hypothetical protein